MVPSALLVLGFALGASCSKNIARRSEVNEITPLPVVATKQRQKIVFTHVMHQMAVGAVNGRNETHLSVEPTRWNGIMATHVPEYVAHYGKPLDAAKQDIAMMKATGVNTIGLLLGNNHLPKSQFAPMIHAYYQAAMDDGEIKIVPDVWGDLSKPEPLADALALIKGQYEGAWLRRDGRLVVSLWLDYGTRSLPRYDETVRRLFEKIGGRGKVFLVCYSPAALKGKNPQWFAGADAFTEWVHDSYGLNLSLLKEAMDAARESGKEFWNPVMPSFTQSRYPHPGITPNVREMLGMTWFRKAWLAAIHADAPAVCLQTWNDLTEDSSVMPESNHGYAYFELNKYYAKWFRSGRQAGGGKGTGASLSSSSDRRRSSAPRGPQADGRLSGLAWQAFQRSGGQPHASDRLRGRGGDAQSPAKVAVMLGEKVIAEKEMPAGVTSWLIYQPRNMNDPASLYPCDPEKSYPKEEQRFPGDAPGEALLGRRGLRGRPPGQGSDRLLPLAPSDRVGRRSRTSSPPSAMRSAWTRTIHKSSPVPFVLR